MTPDAGWIAFDCSERARAGCARRAAGERVGGFLGTRRAISASTPPPTRPTGWRSARTRCSSPASRPPTAAPATSASSSTRRPTATPPRSSSRAAGRAGPRSASPATPTSSSRSRPTAAPGPRRSASTRTPALRRSSTTTPPRACRDHGPGRDRRGCRGRRRRRRRGRQRLRPDRQRSPRRPATTTPARSTTIRRCRARRSRTRSTRSTSGKQAADADLTAIAGVGTGFRQAHLRDRFGCFLDDGPDIDGTRASRRHVDLRHAHDPGTCHRQRCPGVRRRSRHHRRPDRDDGPLPAGQGEHVVCPLADTGRPPTSSRWPAI